MTRDDKSAKPAPRDPLKFDTAVAPLDPPEDFLREAEALGVVFDDTDVAQLGKYLALLIAANAQVNLTAITEPTEAWRRHILDALALLPALADLPKGALIADVGSGGGVPGIPLAITMPHVKFTLIESTGKKADFLRAAAKALSLTNVTVVAERAELVAMHGKPLRESFDAVIARAVGRLNVLVELTLPLVKPGGHALLVKGQKAEEELTEAAAAIGSLGGRHSSTLETPTSRIIILEKASRTPRSYPRRPGDAKRAAIV